MEAVDMPEQLNEKMRRRIRIIGSFPNGVAAFRNVSFIPMAKQDIRGGAKMYTAFN